MPEPDFDQIARREFTKQDIQDHLLAMLVRDFRYDHEPTYGWFPMRHQFAWTMAVEGKTEREIERFVQEQKESFEKESGKAWTHAEMNATNRSAG